MMNKRRGIAALCAFGATIGMLASADVAGGASSGAHFKSTSASIIDGDDLQVSFDEAGVGGETVKLSATATLDETAMCEKTLAESGDVILYVRVDSGPGDPVTVTAEFEAKASVWVGDSSTDSSTGKTSNAGETSENGRIAGVLTLVSDPSGMCEDGETITDYKARWSGVSITDETNGVTVDGIEIS